MNHRDFTTTIVVEQSPSEVYKAINNPGAWWNDDIEGNIGFHSNWVSINL